MATRIPVTHAGTYRPDAFAVLVRKDKKRTHGYAYISSPHFYCADAEQLRQLADTLHDMADQIEGRG